MAGAALHGLDAAAGRHAEPVRTQDGLHWRVSTVAIGSGAVVHIDDRDGAVIRTGRWGRR